MVVCKAVDYANPVQGQLLVDLLNGYALDPMGDGKPLDESVQQNLPAQLAQRAPMAFSFIAYCDADTIPAGLINCFEGFSTFAGKPLVNVHDLYVANEFRGRGVASALLQAAEQQARARDCCKMTLECLSGNQVALGTYHKNGFDNYELDPQNGHALFLEKRLN